MLIKRRHKRGIIIAIGVAIFTMLLLLFQYIYIAIVVKREAEQYSEQLALHTAKEIANSVEVYFRDGLSITNSYASNFLIYKQNKLSRKTIYQLMHGSLSLNKNFLAIWTMWEPNAYDNNDVAFTHDSIHDPKGSFALAFYYQDKQIKYEINDTLDFNEDFYATPKKYKKPVILDPFYYQYHGNEKVFFETSLISPIVEKNQFLGVIGIDIDMYALQDKYSKIRVYDEGFICLLSNSGTIVTHKSTQYIEKNITNYTTNDTTDITTLLKSGVEFSTESYSEFSGKSVSRYYYPININYMAAPWYIMIEIPHDKIYEKADSLRMVSSIFLICSIILLLYLFFNIIDRRRKEKNLLETLKTLENSESRIKDAYHQLSLNEKKLEAIFNQTLIFVGLLDIHGRIIRINKPALDFIQRNEQELIGSLFSESQWWFAESEDRNRLTLAIQDAALGKQTTFETQHCGFDGKTIEVLFSIKPIFNNEGEIIFLLPEGIDITKIKEAELELKKYQMHLEELVIERVAEIKDLNKELMLKNEELNAVNEHILEQKEELSNALEKLTNAQEQLVLSGKMASLGLFTAGIAHEINNPINFISAGTQALFQQLDNLKQGSFADSPEMLEFFKTADFLKQSITKGIDRTTEIILSLRNYSSSNSDVFVKYSIEKCIKDALIILHSKYKNRIQIVEQYNPTPEIDCMPGKINQMFVNILANAIDAIDAIADTGVIKITTSLNEGNVEVVITDTGEGISPENTKKLFDPFFTTKLVGKGVGLGMYIVYNIIEKHNGKIEVLSEINKGTTIIINLPLLQK